MTVNAQHPGRDFSNRVLALSIADLAKSLSVSQRHVYRLLKAGQIPSVKLGRRRLIPNNLVIEMLAVREL